MEAPAVPVTPRVAGSGNLCTSQEARGQIGTGEIDMSWGFWPGRGRTVVALHGITAQYANFVGVAERMEGRRPLLALDLRGRGGSTKPDGPYGMSTHAADVAAAMKAFAIGPSVVVGHSMGAFVATALAAEHPEAVSALVLVDGGLPLEPPPGIPPEQVLDIALSAQVERLSRTFASPEDYLAFWRALPPFSGGRWNRWVEDYLRKDLAGADHCYRPQAFEQAVRADFLDCADAERIRARLASLKVPVLLLRASEGFNPGDPPLCSDETVARESALVADFRDRVLHGCTHYTIALGEAGAQAVADAVVEMAEECGS